MDFDYIDFSEITKEITITGFYSEYLPACFGITEDFFKRIPPKKCDLIKPLQFSMSKFDSTDSRRTISIPEFGSYAVLSNYISVNNIIKEIIMFCDRADNSFSRILNDDNTIMRHEQSYDSFLFKENPPESNYVDNIIKKIIRSIGAKKILKLDISNCYSSFYLHMIPAILLGYSSAENEYKKYLSNHRDTTIDPIYRRYAELDALSRQQNLNQTNGLLIGTQFSKIITEGILTRIDIELVQANIKFSRFVDDYEVYLYEDNEKQIISTFEKILNKYGFALNTEKTQVSEFPYYISENLDKIFRDKTTADIDEIKLMDLFNSFYTLETSGTKGAIRYLLKSIECSEVEINAPELYKSYLITIIRNNERSLTKACSLLIENKNDIILTNDDINIICHQISYHIKNSRDLEVVWLVYLLIETENIHKCQSIIEEIVNSTNELAEVILLRRDLLNTEQLDIILNKCTTWLMIYELYASDKITESQFVSKLSLQKNLNMYKYLKSKNLHFIN